MTKASEDSIASMLKMDTMQPAELDTLLGILANTEHTPGMLLCKAVRQHRLPEGSRPSPDWSACTRTLHNVMIPDTGVETAIKVPHTNFRLDIDHTRTLKDGEQLQI